MRATRSPGWQCVASARDTAALSAPSSVQLRSWPPARTASRAPPAATFRSKTSATVVTARSADGARERGAVGGRRRRRLARKIHLVPPAPEVGIAQHPALELRGEVADDLLDRLLRPHAGRHGERRLDRDP